jgi:SAM-dependent methyltransferase
VNIAVLGQRRLAAQLGNPRGLFGRFVARELNSRNRQLLTAAVTAADLLPGSTAIDVGFGGGLGLQLLLDAVGAAGRVHGVDRSRTAVSAARRRYASAVSAGRLTIHEASMTSLPIEPASLDGVISANTIYFLDDATLAGSFAEFARVLAPAGRTVLGVGDPDAMTKDPLMAHGFRVRSIDTIVAAASAAGLVVTGHERSSTRHSAPHVLIFRRR